MQLTKGTAQVSRVVLALILLGYLVQLVVREVWNEPYPGVFQPRFGVVSPAGTAVVMEPAVVATFADGSTATFHHWDVMAESPSSTFETFRSAFGPDSPRRGSAETISWLGQRLTELQPGKAATDAVIEWDQVTYFLDDEQPATSRPVDRYHVEFGAQHD